MSKSNAVIMQEWGPFEGVKSVGGVTYDGRNVWFAAGDKLMSLDPASGKTGPSIDVAAHAGTAFDGQYLYQLAEDRIQKIDPNTGQVVKTIPSPGQGSDSGLTWAEGTLWVGQYRARKIHQIDPETGTVLRTIESNRFVTGVTWVDGELWHATWEGDESELRRIDPADRAGPGATRNAGGHRHIGARVRRRRSVLLWRRRQRENQGGPPAKALRRFTIAATTFASVDRLIAGAKPRLNGRVELDTGALQELCTAGTPVSRHELQQHCQG